MILLFVISLSALVMFLLWKSLEIYLGRDFISPELLENSDDWIKIKLSNLIIFVYRKYKRTSYFLKQYFEKISRKFFILWYKSMEKIGLGFFKLRDMIKGKYIKRGAGGQASVFLRDVAEYKKKDIEKE